VRSFSAAPIFFLLVLLFSAHSAAQENHSAGPLRVTSPQGSWSLARKTDVGVVFWRAGAPGTTDGMAYANLYEAKGPLDQDGLLAEVKTNVASFFQSPNAIVGEVRFEPRKDRRYPCVDVRSTLQVFANSTLTGESISRPVHLLICQPQGRIKYGFVAGFVYAAERASTSEESEANKFFSGVQLTRDN
jgi:hypothetical protein